MPITLQEFLSVVGATTCGGILLGAVIGACSEIKHRLFLRRIEKRKKECPNCEGTGKVQS